VPKKIDGQRATAGYPSAVTAFTFVRAMLPPPGVISCVMGTATILVAVDRLDALSFPCRCTRSSARWRSAVIDEAWPSLPPMTVSALSVAQPCRQGCKSNAGLSHANIMAHVLQLMDGVGTGLGGPGGRKTSGRESASAQGNLEFRKWSTSACWPCTLAYVTSHTCGGSNRVVMRDLSRAVSHAALHGGRTLARHCR